MGAGGGTSYRGEQWPGHCKHHQVGLWAVPLALEAWRGTQGWLEGASGEHGRGESAGTSQPGPPGFQVTGYFVTGLRHTRSRFEGQCLLLRHVGPEAPGPVAAVPESPRKPQLPARLSHSTLRQPCCAPALGAAILTPCGQSKAAVWGGQCSQAPGHVPPHRWLVTTTVARQGPRGQWADVQ